MVLIINFTYLIDKKSKTNFNTGTQSVSEPVSIIKFSDQDQVGTLDNLKDYTPTHNYVYFTKNGIAYICTCWQLSNFEYGDTIWKAGGHWYAYVDRDVKSDDLTVNDNFTINGIDSDYKSITLVKSNPFSTHISIFYGIGKVMIISTLSLLLIIVLIYIVYLYKERKEVERKEVLKIIDILKE